ncbi:MAG: hypothetical protein OXC44_03610 [Proteobacteria bacterium]|nr:hypothetical protein [Pseudomonadota bacterium]
MGKGDNRLTRLVRKRRSQRKKKLKLRQLREEAMANAKKKKPTKSVSQVKIREVKT